MTVSATPVDCLQERAVRMKDNSHEQFGAADTCRFPPRAVLRHIVTILSHRGSRQVSELFLASIRSIHAGAE
jgi:hypothetical protein